MQTTHETRPPGTLPSAEHSEPTMRARERGPAQRPAPSAKGSSLMRRLRKVMIAIVVVLVLVVGAGVAAWFLVFKTDAAPRASIKATPTVAAPAASLDGTYAVKPGDPDNFVGYRVTEQLMVNIVKNTATGRTDDVTGSLTINGTTVSNVTVTADLRSLISDQGERDIALSSKGLESGRFPEARFVLAQPITLATRPAIGETITARAAGNFTLHGVTRPVVITLQGRWDGKTIQVVGTLPIVFGDYNIAAPTALGVVASVDDHAEMELQLFFKKPRPQVG
jgi:polyisoprenoid-binding protein YceI